MAVCSTFILNFSEICTEVTAAGAAPEAYLRLEDRPVLFPRGDPEGGPASREYPHHLRRAET